MRSARVPGRRWLPSLTDYDLADIDAYHQGTGSRVFSPRDTRRGPQYVTFADVIGSARCWCGEPGGHDWPGKPGGKPHPR